MYFLIASIIALIGITILVVRSRPIAGYHEWIINTDRWMDSWEHSFKKGLRAVLRFIVVHLVGWYRFVVRDITIHKTMKQKVRELLYDHPTHRPRKTNVKIPLEHIDDVLE